MDCSPSSPLIRITMLCEKEETSSGKRKINEFYMNEDLLNVNHRRKKLKLAGALDHGFGPSSEG